MPMIWSMASVRYRVFNTDTELGVASKSAKE